MKTLNVRSALALAVGAAALYTTSIATAQTVVMQPGQAAPPAPAPVVVSTPAPQPAPAPVVVGSSAPPPSSAVVVNNGGAPHGETTGSYTRPNRALLMTGLIVAGAPYVASIGIAATSSHTGDGNLWVPAIGPWLDLGSRGGCPANSDCAGETGNKALLIGDGVLQTVGVLQILGAFIFPETYGGTVVTTASGATLTLTPTKLGRSSYGLSAVGSF